MDDQEEREWDSDIERLLGYIVKQQLTPLMEDERYGGRFRELLLYSDKQSFGDFLRLLRRRLGFTADQVAQLNDISPATLSRAERGMRSQDALSRFDMLRRYLLTYESVRLERVQGEASGLHLQIARYGDEQVTNFFKDYLTTQGIAQELEQARAEIKTLNGRILELEQRLLQEMGSDLIGTDETSASTPPTPLS